MLDLLVMIHTIAVLDSAALIFTTQTLIALSIRITQWCQHTNFTKQQNNVHFFHIKCAHQQLMEQIQLHIITRHLSQEFMSILPTHQPIRYTCACCLLSFKSLKELPTCSLHLLPWLLDWLFSSPEISNFKEI